jgi:hypothetical protein
MIPVMFITKCFQEKKMRGNGLKKRQNRSIQGEKF